MKGLRLSVRGQLVLSALWLSLNAQTAALLPIVIPTQILLFVTPGQVGNAQQAIFLGWLATIASAVSLFMPPLVGTLSDHTPGRFGRRRPYIAIGGLLTILSTPLLAFSGNVIFFLAGLTVLHLGNNILTPAYQSLIPDRVPKQQRGEASGYVGGMTILGNVVSLGLAAVLLGGINQNSFNKSVIRYNSGIYYIVTAAALAVALLITLIGVHEIPLTPHTRSSQEAKEKFTARFARWFVHGWMAPWRSYNFVVVFLTRSSIMLGLAMFMTFVEYYFARVQHITNFVQVTAIVAVLALCGGIVSGIVFGILSDRLKRRAPVVCLATLCMGLASLAFVIFPSSLVSWLWPLGVLFGLGNGAYTSVDWALSIDVLPSLENAGEGLGLWNASTTLPAILAPLLGNLIINITDSYGQVELGYRLIFTAATLFLVVAAVGILFVREQKSNKPDDKKAMPIGWKFTFQARAGKARGFLRAWPLWEILSRSLWHVQPIPHAPHHLLEVRFTHHSGKPLDLPDGTHIQKGDPIIELHFRNQAFLDIAGTGEAWRYMRMIEQNLQALARWMQEPDFPSNARVIFGATLLSRGARRLGFMVRERPKNLYTWLDRFYMTGLLVLYNPQGRERLLQGTTYGTYPQEVWMSREELLKRYGNSSSPAKG